MKEMPADRLPGQFDGSTDAFGLFGVRMGQTYPEEVWKIHLSWPIAKGVSFYHPQMTTITRESFRLIFGDEDGKMTDEMMILMAMSDNHINGSYNVRQTESAITSLMDATGHLQTVFDIIRLHTLTPRRREH